MIRKIRRLHEPPPSTAETDAGRMPPPLEDIELDGVGKAELARVLVVEDDFLVAMELESGLADAGFIVVGVAATAEEAIRLAKSEHPHLVVMDVRLASVRDGVDAALVIFKTQGIRSIFATAHQDDVTTVRAKPSKPLGWLAKPYVVSALVAAIKEALPQLGKAH
jgi:DNA-binding NarL/FixJ family response regulator